MILSFAVTMALLLLVCCCCLCVNAHFPLFPDKKVRDAVSLRYEIVEPIATGLGTVKFEWSCSQPSCCGPAHQSNDWISLWVSGSNFTFVRYVNATAAHGQDTFRMVNVPTQSYFLRYFRGDAVVKTAGPIEPVRHIPLEFRVTTPSDDPTELVISWTTDRFSPAAAAAAAAAEAGAASGAGAVGCKVVTTEGGHSRSSSSRTIIASSTRNTSTYTQRDFLERVRLPLKWPIRSSPLANISQRRIWSSCHNSECFNDDTAATYYSDPGIFVNVRVTGLVPDTPVTYSCGELAAGRAMSEPRIVTPRPRAGARSSRRLVWLADTGTGYGTVHDPLGGSVMGGVQFQNPFDETNRAAFVFEALQNKVRRGAVDPSLVVLGGDISYCRGHMAPCWQMFMHITEGLFSETNFIALAGNHDADYLYDTSPVTNGQDSGGEAGIVWTRRYNVDIDHQYYVRRTGHVTLIVLDSESDAQPQVRWLLDSVLPNINRTETPWVIFSLHRPPLRYFNQPTQEYFADHFGDIFDAAADVVLFGHDHLYARRVPLLSVAIPNPARCKVEDDDDKAAAYNQRCRVSFTVYPFNAVADPARCYLGASFEVSTAASAAGRDACRSACAGNLSCNGIELTPSGTKLWCQLISCAVDGSNLVFNKSVDSVSAMKRVRRSAPVYVLDGAGGQTCEQPMQDAQGRVDPRIVKSFWCQPGDRNKQTFDKFGWTEIETNETTLVLEHFHFGAPDDVVDRFVLTV